MIQLPDGWTKKNEKLLLVLKCKDFKHAVALFNSISAIAEKLQHHPDIGIRNYSELLVSTTTHSENKLTNKDYKLAQEISNLINYQFEKHNIESNGRN